MLTVVDLQPIADALLRQWQAMDPATRDPDYPSYVYDLAREYAAELQATQLVSESEIKATVAAGDADAVITAYNQASANAAAAAAGVTDLPPVSLDPNAEFTPVVIPFTRGPTESTEGASLPPGYQLLPGETIAEAMSRRFFELYPGGLPPDAGPAGPPSGGGTPSAVLPEDDGEGPATAAAGESRGIAPLALAGLGLGLALVFFRRKRSSSGAA